MAGGALKKTAVRLGLLLLYSGCGWLLLRERIGTWEWIGILRLVMLTILPHAAGLLSLSAGKSLFVFPLLFLEARLFSPLLWNLPALLLFLTADLLLLHRLSRCRFLPVCLSVLPAAGCVLLYDLLCSLCLNGYYRFFRQVGGGAVEKGAFLLTASALSTRLLYGILVLFRRKRPGLDILSVNFQGLEGYVLAIFCSVFLFLALAQWIHIPGEPVFLRTDLMESAPAVLSPGYLLSLRLIWLLIQGVVLALHGAYILLLFRAVHLRQRVQTSEENHAALSRFTAELEENLTDMSGVRHDVKNLLLTMGGFVSRSADPEMQAFWQERICPCLEITLRQNSLFHALRTIPDEGLKSFLYYKLTQAADNGVSVRPDICLEGAELPVTGDLIRLLGIFLDNAMEETALAGGEIELSIVRLQEGFRMRVMNPVREEVRARGIHTGISEKGPGRGNGLRIAAGIVERYDRLVWNSYFTDEGFAQVLFLSD